MKPVLFIKSTNHNVVDVFRFPAEAGIGESFLLSLYKMLNVTDQHGFRNANRSFTRCKIFAGVVRRPLDIPGSETGSLVCKGQGSPE